MKGQAQRCFQPDMWKFILEVNFALVEDQCPGPVEVWNMTEMTPRANQWAINAYHMLSGRILFPTPWSII